MQSVDRSPCLVIKQDHEACCILARMNPDSYMVESRGCFVCRYCGAISDVVYDIPAELCAMNMEANGRERRKPLGEPVFEECAARTDLYPGFKDNRSHYRRLQYRNRLSFSTGVRKKVKRKAQLNNVCTQLGLRRKDIREMAWKIFLQCIERRLTSGGIICGRSVRASVRGLMLNAVRFACMIQKHELFVSELIGWTREDRKKNRDFVSSYPIVYAVVREMGFKKVVDQAAKATSNIHVVGERYGLPMEIIRKAEDVMNRARLNTTGKRPMPFAAAYLYFAASVEQVDVDVKVLSAVVGTSAMTINTRCDEIVGALADDADAERYLVLKGKKHVVARQRQGVFVSA